MPRKIIAILIVMALTIAVASAGDFHSTSIYYNESCVWKPASADNHQDTILNCIKKLALFENAYLFIRVDGPSTMNDNFYLIFEGWNSFLPNGPYTNSTSALPEFFLRDSIYSDTVLHYNFYHAADTAIGQWFNYIIYVSDTLDEPDTAFSIEEYLMTF